MAYSDLFAIFSLGGTDIRGWLKYIWSRFQFAYAECLSDSGASSGGGGQTERTPAGSGMRTPGHPGGRRAGGWAGPGKLQRRRRMMLEKSWRMSLAERILFI